MISMEEKSRSDNFVVKSVSLKEIILHLYNWAKFLVSRWRLITIGTIVGAVIGIGYSLISKPDYKADIVFVLANSNKASGGYSSIAAQLGFSLGGTSGGGLFQEDDNIIIFMKSRTMIEQTLLSEVAFSGKKELLADRYMNVYQMKKGWSENPRLRDFKFDQNMKGNITQDSLINELYKRIVEKNLSVDKPDKKGDVIVASTSSRDELFSKLFTEKLLENVTNFYVKTQVGKAQENVTILQRQVDSIRNLLNVALSSVALTSEANPNPNPAFQRLNVPSQKKMIDVEMNKSILIELVKNLEISKISLRKETPLVQVIDRPILPLTKKRIGKLKGVVGGGFLGGLLIVMAISLKLFKRRVFDQE